MDKNIDLCKKVKNQIVKGFLYWVMRYISIFVCSALVIVLITITVGTPLYMIFGKPDNWMAPLIGVSCGCLVSITYFNIPRYQNCWLSIKLNFIRYRILRIIEKCPISTWKEVQIKGYIDSELKDFMEDFTL